MSTVGGGTDNPAIEDWYLEERRFPVLRRVVRSPERWQRIVEIALAHGEKLPPAPDAKALNDFLLKRRSADPLRFADLSLSVIKLLGRGEYAASFPDQEVTGHFGLAVSEYTHSTAPNRRRAIAPGAGPPRTPSASGRSATRCGRGRGTGSSGATGPRRRGPPISRPFA